ncbi:integrase [Streptococcus moroccensis]|uniref:Integrase n=1 Tax=Streptococcus moroccensis TaxID=1451356 RepID=A0ABT9YQ41_9STRE|nr:integrase [Streptococcus moroccensis]
MLLQEEIEKPKSEMTFRELTDKWLKDYERDVVESTYIKTERNLKNHILPSIGDRQIAAITPLELQNHVNEWVRKIKYGGKLLGLVRNIYRYAIRFEYVESSPAESLSAPKIKREINSKKKFWNKDELQKFMELVEETEDIKKIALFRVLAFTGVRIGELQALTWDDFYDGTLNINKAVSRGHTGLEISTTKNKSSERLISLDGKTEAILNDLKKQCPKSKLIFGNSQGGIMPPPLPRKWLLSIIKNSDLELITIHGFRHTHASLIFDAGMTLKQAQYRLGHSDLKTTMNVYTHITQKAVDDIADKLSNYLDF